MVTVATVWMRHSIKVADYKSRWLLQSSGRETRRALIRGHKGGGEKWLESEYILKVEPRGFADPDVKR